LTGCIQKQCPDNPVTDPLFKFHTLHGFQEKTMAGFSFRNPERWPSGQDSKKNIPKNGLHHMNRMTTS